MSISDRLQNKQNLRLTLEEVPLETSKIGHESSHTLDFIAVITEFVDVPKDLDHSQ